MATVSRIRVTWSGTPVTGPGISTFYVDGALTAGWPAALVTLFTSWKGFFPSGITWTIPGVADLLDVSTGVLTGANAPGGGGVVGSSGGAVDFKPGVGARVRWATAGVVAGRKVTGTTFLVPVASVEIPNGVPSASLASTGPGAANTYRLTAGITPVVYSKPTVSRGGTVHPITSTSMPSSLTWLRSRRT